MKVEEIDVDEQIGEVGQILSEAEKKKGILIHVLQKIQEDNGYLPGDVLSNLSKKLYFPLSEIYSVASFYKQFHFKPRGKKIVKICMGTACYVRGAKEILNTVEERFNVKAGETTEDLAVTLETVGCIGCCGLAPVATVNDEVKGEISSKKLDRLIKFIKEE
ncbi:MAG: NAD(P)H-dependent oxidoreductase subunit E [Nitrospirae bacterium]|jgi:NADH:ubiquinone oxidoreductase subunit E|nr:NAD(P)H-dependent oxidoreductase subunit E [Nitrospirota bacterium]